MNILVTGCAGYIGSILCQQLLQLPDYNVIGIDNFTYNNQNAILHLLGYKNFALFKEDIRNVNSWKSLLADADVIMPLAAIVGAPACKNNKDSYAINTTAIIDMVKLLSAKQRIISPCTNSGYGVGGASYCDETSPMNPISEYGVQKCEAEKYILGHPNAVSLRLATVFGTSPRMRFDLLVNDFFRHLFYKKSLVLFEGHFKRNAVHIRDVARAFIWMLNSRFQGPYNVGCPDLNLSKYAFAEAIRLYAGFNHIDYPITDGNGKDEDQRDYIVSNQKILHTGFQFKYDLREGVDELYSLCNTMSYQDTMSMGNV